MPNRLSITNVRRLRQVEFELGRLTVLVGPNGVGKSTALEAAELAMGSTDRALRDAARARLAAMRSFGATGPARVDLGDGFPLIAGEEGPAATAPAASTGLADAAVDAAFERVVTSRRGTYRRWRLDAAAIAAEHVPRSADADAEVETSGRGLVSVIQRLQVERDPRLEAIEADLRSIVPTAQRLKAVNVDTEVDEELLVSVAGGQAPIRTRRRAVAHRLELEQGRGNWFPANALSEGTLLAIGLAVMLHTGQDLILLDDIDRGLHPRAQHEAIRVLKAALDRRATLQILTTTHSPFVVDVVDADQVYVLDGDEHHTQAQRLDKHPTWERRKPYLKAGEFWSLVEEQWVRS